MVVRVGTAKVTRFKSAIKIKGPRTVGSFTFQRVVIPGGIEVVVDKGGTKVVKACGS